MVEVTKLVHLDPGVLIPCLSPPHLPYPLVSVYEEGQGRLTSPSRYYELKGDIIMGQADFHKLNVDCNSMSLDWTVLLAENILSCFLILVD